MLTPEYLDGIAEPLQAIYSELESAIMADIARRIAKANYTTNTAAWQLYKLQAVGASQDYIAREIAKTLKISEKEVYRIFSEAGIKSMQTDMATQKAAIEAGKLPANTIPLTASAQVAQILNANALRTQNTMKKLTGTIAIDASGKLNQYMDQCQLMVQSGAFTQDEAINTTVRRFAADGVKAFEYEPTARAAALGKRGVRTSVEAAVRRACVTGVGQATGKISENNAATLQTNLVEVTSHADARPDHAAWQGKIYSLSGGTDKYPNLAEKTGYGTGAGLKGWNCRHDFYPYIEGVSEKVPREKYDKKTYEAEQIQRYNERQVRYWKKRKAAVEAGGLDASAERKRVSYWQKRQREHLNETGLTRQYQREKVIT